MVPGAAFVIRDDNNNNNNINNDDNNNNNENKDDNNNINNNNNNNINIINNNNNSNNRSVTAKPKSALDGLLFLAGSTDPSTNNVPSAVPYLESLSNYVLARLLVQLLSVIITTGGVIL